MHCTLKHLLYMEDGYAAADDVTSWAGKKKDHA
jgi:hypothetical protein